MSLAARSQSGQNRCEPGVEERVPGPVRAAGIGELVGEQRPAELVRVERVEARVAHGRRDAGHRVDDPRDAGTDLLGRGGPARRPLGVGGPGEVREVVALRLVELERVGDRLEDAVRDAARVAPLEPRVVLDADPGEQRDLLAPEAATRRWRPNVGSPTRSGVSFGAAGGEELSDLGLGAHCTLNRTPPVRARGGTASTPKTGAFLRALPGWFHTAMTTDTAPLGGIPTTGTPVATLSLVGGRQRPVKIVEHPTFRGHARHEHPHAGLPAGLPRRPRPGRVAHDAAPGRPDHRHRGRGRPRRHPGVHDADGGLTRSSRPTGGTR